MDNLTTQCGDHKSISLWIKLYPITPYCNSSTGIYHTCLTNLTTFWAHDQIWVLCQAYVILAWVISPHSSSQPNMSLISGSAALVCLCEFTHDCPPLMKPHQMLCQWVLPGPALPQPSVKNKKFWLRQDALVTSYHSTKWWDILATISGP
jgi:hypothetical protein